MFVRVGLACLTAVNLIVTCDVMYIVDSYYRDTMDLRVLLLAVPVSFSFIGSLVIIREAYRGFSNE